MTAFKSRKLCSRNGAEVGLLGTPGHLKNAGCNAFAEAASWAAWKGLLEMGTRIGESQA